MVATYNFGSVYRTPCCYHEFSGVAMMSVALFKTQTNFHKNMNCSFSRSLPKTSPLPLVTCSMPVTKSMSLRGWYQSIYDKRSVRYQTLKS